MKRLLIVVVLVLAASSSAAAQKSAPGRLKQELLQVQKQVLDAHIRLDKAALDNLIAADYIQCNAEGKKIGKAEVFSTAPTPKDMEKVKLAETLSDVQARDYGAVALLNYISNLTGKVGEQKIDEQYRVTDIYRRRNGQWQIIFRQSTIIPKQTSPQ